MNDIETKKTEEYAEVRGAREIIVFTNEETSDIGYVLCCLTTCCCPFNVFFLFLTDRTTYVVHG